MSTSANSVRSIDLDNPDPKTVQKVGRHLVPEQSAHDSLKLQGGDITREIYNWQREHNTEEGEIKRGRSRSIDMGHPNENDSGQARDMLVPGGFRRDYVASHVPETDSVASIRGSPRGSFAANSVSGASFHPVSSPGLHQPELAENHVFTRNFIEFLSLYGHFAGEELEEDLDEESDSETSDGATERSRLLHPQRPRNARKMSHQQAKGQASTMETIMLLLKSFVGTGVLFLPRAFYNGGILFSSTVLIFVSFVSYWCFMQLIQAKEFTKMSSFGDIGGALFGERTRTLILGCIVLSQIGFASAYIVFVAENLHSFIYNVTHGETLMNVSTLIVLQLFVFLPLSMIRDIAKLGFTALIADAFILAGLVYLYSWSGFKLLSDGVADVALFNSSNWTLFIGTAVFTFEGIGLIIPIQESMRQPQKFGPVLAGVMVGITFVFVSIGALLYAATGSSVETVILLNLPKSSITDIIQLLYSLAILLSTPLQLFPAIRILENTLFVRSGKFSRKIKWEKNVFRFFLVFFTGLVAYCGADDLDKFVALTGSVACVPLVYIFPPLLHMHIVQRGSLYYYLDIILAIFGLCMMLYTSGSTIISWASG